MASRAFSAPCQTRRHSKSSYELCTSCYELLRYNTILKPSSDELLREAYELLRYDTILKPSSDEFTTIFLRVSAITVRLSTSCLQISIWNRKESHCNATASKAFSVADLRCTIASFSRVRQFFLTKFKKNRRTFVATLIRHTYVTPTPCGRK